MLTLNFMWNEGERIYSYKNNIHSYFEIIFGRKLNELEKRYE